MTTHPDLHRRRRLEPVGLRLGHTDHERSYAAISVNDAQSVVEFHCNWWHLETPLPPQDFHALSSPGFAGTRITPLDLARYLNRDLFRILTEHQSSHRALQDSN